MKTKVIASVLLFSVLASGCSSIRMKYSGRVEADDGRTASYEYQMSQDIGAVPVLCGLTAIFLGGACWYYLAMPTVNQTRELRRLALDRLESKAAEAWGEDVSCRVVGAQSTHTGWRDAPEEISFSPAQVREQ